MLTVELNDRLTRVGAGTPMGELMRRYWHPIATAAEMKKNATKSVRLLGEDLVLYKDRSGRLGLIEASCAHRRVNMLFGIPEDNGLRCPYHGWLYDETGQCLEMPAEAADSTFCQRVKLRAYPAEALGGLIFAYLGPQPAPLVPRYYPFVEDGMVRDIGWAVVPCNWLQIMENSLDPIHGEYLHRYFSNYVLEQLGILEDRGNVTGTKPFVPKQDAEPYWRRGAKIAHHAKAGFSIFEHGILKHRLIDGEDEATSASWRIGHPVVMPNLEHGSGGHHFQIRVPMDDTHTYYVWYAAKQPKDGENTNQAPDEIPVYKVPMPGVDEDGLPIWGQLDNNSGQDNFAWTSQGPLTKRWKEKLGQSDVGIIMYRRLLLEQIKIVEDGGEPMNTFRDPAKNQMIMLPFDGQEDEGGRSKRTDQDVYGYGRRTARVSSGQAGKFNTTELERAARAGATLPPPYPVSARPVTEVSPG
jgi:5,5'-dehydrodivanillate O-demethylase oxygenase subunit